MLASPLTLCPNKVTQAYFTCSSWQTLRPALFYFAKIRWKLWNYSGLQQDLWFICRAGDVCIICKALLSRSEIAPVSCGQALLNSFYELWKLLIHLADTNIKAIYRFDINKFKRQCWIPEWTCHHKKVTGKPGAYKTTVWFAFCKTINRLQMINWRYNLW